MTVVDYSRIDSGLGGPPYPVSVVGPDRLGNWAGLDKSAYQDKRKRWSEAIVATIDQEFPGFASHVVAAHFNTARSLADYLNAPHGAVYGFAPTPPSGPIWKGIDRSVENGNPGTLPGVGLCRCRRLHRGDRRRGECGEPRSRAAREEEAVIDAWPLFARMRPVARLGVRSQEPDRTRLERPCPRCTEVTTRSLPRVERRARLSTSSSLPYSRAFTLSDGGRHAFNPRDPHSSRRGTGAGGRRQARPGDAAARHHRAGFRRHRHHPHPRRSGTTRC